MIVMIEEREKQLKRGYKEDLGRLFRVQLPMYVGY